MRNQSIMHRFRRFCRDEDGILLSEFLILLPLLIWAYLAFFLFWDAFASINRAQKASYAISDAISRTQNTIATTDINTYVPVLQLLAADHPSIAASARLRVTSFQWDEPNDEYVVLFSYSPGSRMPALTATDLTAMAGEIPTMSNRDSLVLLETQIDYRAPMNGNFAVIPFVDLVIPQQTLNNRIYERPRFVRRICMNSGFNCPATL